MGNSHANTMGVRRKVEKEMKIKVGQLVNSAQALSRLVQQPMKAQYSFPLSRLAKQIEPELKTYDETRMKLLQENGTLSEDGKSYFFVDNKKSDEFADELQAVLDSEVELEFKTIALDKLDRIEISAADLTVLDWLVKEE